MPYHFGGEWCGYGWVTTRMVSLWMSLGRRINYVLPSPSIDSSFAPAMHWPAKEFQYLKTHQWKINLLFATRITNTPLPNFLAKFQPLQAKWWKMQCVERPIGSAFSGGAICKNFMFFLQGAKGFYDLLLISALFFCFFIRRSKTADLVQNLVYIILDLE